MRIYTSRSDAEIERVVYGELAGVHLHALEEDVGISVAHPRRERRESFKLDVTGKNAEKLIENAFAVHNHWGALPSIVDFIEGAAKTIARHGEAWYEIALDTAERRFRVLSVIPGTLRVTRLGAIQILRSDIPRRHLDAYFIPRNVLRCFLPPQISPRRWRKMVLQLSELEHAQLKGMELPLRGGCPTYGLSEHARSVSNGILAATNPIQYPPRNYDYNQGVSPALYGYRWALFQSYCTRLRSAIVAEINSILQTVGTRLDFTATVYSRENVASAEQWQHDAMRIRDSADPDGVVRELLQRQP